MCYVKLAVLLVACGVLSSCTTNEEPPQQPNIIFILTDDQGFGDLGVAGHPYLKTPNLDRLAGEGTRFTQFYVNATVCAPSRVALMTGQFPARHNVHHIYSTPEFDKKRGVPAFLDPSVATVADLMQSAGYTTGHIGKWHLCGNEGGSPTPDQYGFDSYLISHNGGQSPIYQQRFASTEREINESSQWIMDDGIDFIREHKDDGKPFYLQLWTLVPHAPLNPSPAELAVYESLRVGPDEFPSWMSGYADSAADLDTQMKVYLASMTSLDAAIGRLLDYLDKSGLAENTLIFFTSDNGPEDYHIGNARNAGVGSPGVFRGRKRSMYEGGVRVPCIVRWPGKVPANKVSEAVWSGVDWMPTLAKITGTSLPDGFEPDGEDVLDIFYGANRPHKKPLCWEWKFDVRGDRAYMPPQLAIREGDWKLLCNPDGTNQELYNLSKDPEERQNLAREEAGLVKELTATLLNWKKSIPESAYADNKE